MNSTATKPRTITVRATCNLREGRNREIALYKGETRRIGDPGERGLFWTTTRGGRLFGLCRLGSGWERVERVTP